MLSAIRASKRNTTQRATPCPCSPSSRVWQRGISAQSQRLNGGSNLANVDAVAGPTARPQGWQVVFQTTPMGADSAAGVRVSSIKGKAMRPDARCDQHPG